MSNGIVNARLSTIVNNSWRTAEYLLCFLAKFIGLENGVRPGSSRSAVNLPEIAARWSWQCRSPPVNRVRAYWTVLNDENCDSSRKPPACFDVEQYRLSWLE